ncbi:glycine cleavage system protein GcvH [candidate division KSB1 bacterium]|nr:glycine cleavage system protein GcvH [candidate division KSB1 bacterium]MCH8018910.1 glycine cleavage system protein GcvH [candidate division KSB1 bacterium]
MEIPEALQYTSEHEWIAIEDDVATIGITDYAQGELGDIVFVELPNKGDSTNQTEAFGTIEAVKAVSELYAPLSGEIKDVNSILEEQPELINNDPYGEGWIIKLKISDESELEKLLSAEEYQSQIS